MYDSGRNNFCHSCRVAVALFDVLQRLGTQRETRLVLGQKLRDPRVEVPAEIVKSLSGPSRSFDRVRFSGPGGRSRTGLPSQRADLVSRLGLEMQEAENDVCDLHARIIDVVLYLDSPPGIPQDPREGVTKHRVAQVPDVRRLVRVDARMLDNGFPAVRSSFGGPLPSLATGGAEKFSAIKKRVQIPTAR